MLPNNVRDNDPSFFCLAELLSNADNEHDLEVIITYNL